MEKSHQRKRKKYHKLVAELSKLERELFLNSYSYQAFLQDGEVYVRFPSRMNYPVKMVEMLLKDAKKKSLDEGFSTMGLILEMPPNLLGKKGSSKVSTRGRKVAKKPLKRAKKLNKKPVKKKLVLKRDNNGRFKKHK